MKRESRLYYRCCSIKAQFSDFRMGKMCVWVLMRAISKDGRHRVEGSLSEESLLYDDGRRENPNWYYGYV